MVVAACLCRLSLPAGESLKDKRRVVKSLIDRVKNRYNVSVAEVDHQDHHHLADIGLAAVSNDGDFAREVLEGVVRFIERNSGADLIDYRIDIL
ncbi:MAG TPA: DUF503 domain-containing protein [Bacillota bacterium]|jgi:hypothetical protein